MQLFHATCAITGKTPARMILIVQGVSSTRTYRCERCGTYVHIDMDWSEGARPEKDAKLD